MSIFEPGFLQIVLAHARNGSMPPASIVKLEFSAGRLIFGMPANQAGLEAYLSMLSDTGITWMVNFRDGDLMQGLGKLVIQHGGHIRVGIEDYGGDRVPSNVELVSEMVELGKSLGRPPASIREAADLIGLGPHGKPASP